VQKLLVCASVSSARVATWNLERPGERLGVKAKRQLDQIAQVAADLWILTETHSSIQLPGYVRLATTPEEGYHASGESCVAIHTRWRVAGQVMTYNDNYAVCAVLKAPWGPTLVYGTIITWPGDRGPQGDKKRWELHRHHVQEQGRDWRRLRHEFPHYPLIVGGDFNESLDGSGWLEDGNTAHRLAEQLSTAELRCITERNFRASKELDRASVHHICVSRPFADKVRATTSVWPGRGNDGPMSDHNGVCVTLEYAH
jgi:hypothetical protein